MKIDRPSSRADDSPRIRDLWPILAGPLVVGGAIFWIAYIVYLVQCASERLQGRHG